MSITAEGDIVILQSVSNDFEPEIRDGWLVKLVNYGEKESYVEYQVEKCYCAQCKDKEKTYLYLYVKFSFKNKPEEN